MFKGTSKAKELFEEYCYTRPVLVIFDPDVDGLISGLFICRFLEYCGLEYKYYINQNRKHGFFIDVEKVRGYTVIATDFQIYDEVIEEFIKNDVVLINIDHHEIEGELREWDKGVVINNQYYFEDEEKRYLSGAGVVFEVLCDWNEAFYTEENVSLVGITLLSDVRPIENSGARKYLTTLYNNDCSEGYMKYLVENTMKSTYGFGAPRMDRNYIDFTFSPRINSMLRFNESYEAVEFILGRGMKTEDRREEQKQYVQYLTEISRLIELPHCYVVIVNKEDIHEYNDVEPTNFIGLACSRIKDRGKSCIIALYENGVLQRASFRGKCDGIKYLTEFRKMGVVAFGHEPAFGIHEIEIEDEKLEEYSSLIERLESKYVRTNKIIEVENLSAFCINRGRKVADRNNLVRDCFRTCIKYNGAGIQKIRGGEKYIEYLVDGHTVKSFNPELSVNEGYIIPTTEKGYLVLYLREPTAVV